MLTKRQKETYDYIVKFEKSKGYAPSLEEISKYLKISSISTAHHHVKKLQELGYLQKGYNQPRAIVPMQEQETIEIPVKGKIAAGQPIEAVELSDETITITKDTIGRHGNYYALRVVGNSMIDEGIFDEDIVVIRKQEYADNGQTVVAIIDDNSATLKKF